MRLPLAAACLCALVLAGCSSNSGGSGGTTTDNPATTAPSGPVHLTNYDFTPSSLAIHVGDTVRWINDVPTLHKVQVPQAQGQQGTPNFDRDAPTGVPVEYTFTSAGTYNVRCTYHEDQGMTMTVTVT